MSKSDPSFVPVYSREWVDREIRSVEDSRHSLSRRNFLVRAKRLAILTAAASVYPTYLGGQLRGRLGIREANPDGAPVGGPGGGEGEELDPNDKRVLTLEDFTFETFYRFPTAQPRPGHATGRGSAFRIVGDQVRVFHHTESDVSPGDELVEYRIPYDDDVTFSTVKSTSPRVVLVRNWGTYDGALDEGISNPAAGRYIWWDPVENLMRIAWQQVYAGQTHHVNNSAIDLNEGTFTKTVYGSHRTQEHPKTIRNFIEFPAWLSSQLGGRWVGRYGGTGSGVALSPMGPNVIAMRLDQVNPRTLPTDGSGVYSYETQRLLYHNEDHPKAIQTNWRGCGWPGGSTTRDYAVACDITGCPEMGGERTGKWPGYDCAYPRDFNTGVPIDPFNGYDTFAGKGGNSSLNPEARFWTTLSAALGENNSITGGVYIDLPEAHALMQFGFLCGTPPGHTVPNDPDNLAHSWYGDPGSANDIRPITGTPKNTSYQRDGVLVYQSQQCCHGQDSPDWGGTGDAAYWYLTSGWIYNPVNIALGLSPWLVTPTIDEFYVRYADARYGPALLTQIKSRKDKEQIGTCWVDRANRKLYMMIDHEDSNDNEPVIARFSIRQL